MDPTPSTGKTPPQPPKGQQPNGEDHDPPPQFGEDAEQKMLRLIREMRERFKDYVPPQSEPAPKPDWRDTFTEHQRIAREKEHARMKAQMQDTFTSRVGSFMTKASHIEAKKTEWLWRHRLARGALHLIAGQPGTGKSTIAFDLAARISSGGKWPDGTVAPKGRVVIWSGEDNIATTIVPRLMAAGADLDNILIISGDGQPFNPVKDLERLERDLAGLEDVVMLIVDPVVSIVKGDSHKNAEVRNGLQPLVDLIEKRNIVGIGITHFAKGTQGRNTHERVIGSVAFTAVARVVFATAGAKDELRLVVAKINIGPSGGGFAYKIAVTTVGDGIEATRIEWGDALDGKPEDLIREVEGDKGGRPRERDGAAVFIEMFLADGEPRLFSDIEAEGAKRGISRRTLQRVAKEVPGVVTGIKVDPKDPRSKQMWRLVRVKF